MAELRFKNRSLPLQPYESVLDCLLRNGEHLPYACKAGMCQACLIRAVDCEATPESRKWIKPALQARGYTLACQWVPEGDVAAEVPAIEEFSVAARIDSLAVLNERVMRVCLRPEDPARMFAYRPGQYLTLINPAGLARSYSIANDYEAEGFIELHIASTTHGEFTQWLFTKAQSGMMLHMRGPAGECHYANIDGDSHPLLLAGTGTGLAPLYGIARDALQRGHRGEINLYHGGRTTAQLYYVDELRALALAHPNFHYHGCVSDTGAAAGLLQGRLEPLVEKGLDSSAIAQTQAYLCGAPEFVHAMRKRLFLKGLRSANIHCDPFTERTVV
ncbi:MAG: ferredoxin reductase [Pseudomonadota bacterium]|jgi:ferredoxin-NADP reductase/ferredoxin